MTSVADSDGPGRAGGTTSDRPGPGRRGAEPPAGEAAASFEALIRQHGPWLLGVARRLRPPGIEPEDLIQDVFERAWRVRHSFRGDASVATWLHAILLNRMRDLLRRRRSCEQLVAEPPDAPDALAGVDDPAALLDALGDEEEMRRFLHRLPLPERAALVLHHCGGLSAEQVGSALGCSTAAAHKRIQRGRLHLLSIILRDAGVTRLAHPPTPLPTDCRRARLLVWAYLDGLLDDSARGELEEHVAGCPRCPALVQGLTAVMARLGPDVPGEFPEHLVARIRASLTP